MEIGFALSIFWKSETGERAAFLLQITWETKSFFADSALSAEFDRLRQINRPGWWHDKARRTQEPCSWTDQSRLGGKNIFAVASGREEVEHPLESLRHPLRGDVRRGPGIIALGLEMVQTVQATTHKCFQEDLLVTSKLSMRSVSFDTIEYSRRY